MTVTASDIQNALATTYSSQTSPTATQVTALIARARLVIEATVGAVPDEDETDEAELVVDVTIRLLMRAKHAALGFSQSSSAVGTKSMQEPEILTPGIKARLERVYGVYLRTPLLPALGNAPTSTGIDDR